MVTIDKKIFSDSLNIYSKSNDWHESILSNFAHTPFVIEINNQKFECASVEGFWQGLKFENEKRLMIFKLFGSVAKKEGEGINIKYFEIAGLNIKYGNKKHENLIREAIKQKVLQNELVKQALIESKGKTITHIIPDQVQPKIKMEELLMSVRKELFGY